MKALLTGSSGFLGARLARHLAAKGWEVHHLLRRPPAGLANAHAYDGSYGAVEAAMLHARPDVVLHVGAKVQTQHSPAELDDFLRSNVMLGAQLAQAMAVAATPAIVVAGSSMQCWDGGHENPANLYGANKLAQQVLIDYFVGVAGLRSITLMLHSMYGPGDAGRRLLTRLLEPRGPAEALGLSPGQQLLDLVHVDDVCLAFETAAALSQGLQAGTSLHYAVNADRRVTLAELVQVCEAVTGRALNVKLGAQPYRSRELMVPCTHLERLPGWRPAIGLEDGIRGMAADAN